MPKKKCLEKFQKIHIKFLREKRGRGVPGKYQGVPPGRHTTWWPGLPWVAPCPSVGHPRLPPTLSPATFFSLLSKLQFIAQNRVLSVLSLNFFDLLAQPIFLAEIWSICSLVCDSSPCPSRFVFSGLYLEYFAAVGDRL